MNLENFAKILPMDKFLPNHIYACSINPCDKYQYWCKADRIELSQRYVRNSLSQFKGTVFYLNTEISPKGRIHYHGTVESDDYHAVYKLFLLGFPSILSWATAEVDTIETSEKGKNRWNEYITKQEPLLMAVGCTPRILCRYKELPIPTPPRQIPHWFDPTESDEAKS